MFGITSSRFWLISGLFRRMLVGSPALHFRTWRILAAWCIPLRRPSGFVSSTRLFPGHLGWGGGCGVSCLDCRARRGIDDKTGESHDVGPCGNWVRDRSRFLLSNLHLCPLPMMPSTGSRCRVAHFLSSWTSYFFKHKVLAFLGHSGSEDSHFRRLRVHRHEQKPRVESPGAALCCRLEEGLLGRRSRSKCAFLGRASWVVLEKPEVPMNRNGIPACL